MKQLKVNGESADVQGETVDSWKEMLPEIVKGYAKEDICNMDEMGVFWQALSARGFGQKGKHCYGGKKSKEQVTVAFFVSLFLWQVRRRNLCTTPPPKLHNFKAAVQSLEDDQQFLESRGYIEALRIGSAIDTMTVLKLKSSKQTTRST